MIFFASLAGCSLPISQEITSAISCEYDFNVAYLEKSKRKPPQIVNWYYEGAFRPAIYCEDLKSALYIHTFLLAPIGSWRTAWRSLTKKAGLPGFRFHDLRHCAITSLAENGASDSTIMAIAGHVSRRMLERYSHVRMEAKRQALEVLSQSTEMAGYDTKGDTNKPSLTVRPS